MSLEKLLEEGLIGAIEPTRQLVEKALELAESDLSTAKAVLQTSNFDWTLAIAYNSMLQSGRALMFHCGFRPKGEYKHVAVVKFAAEKLGRESSGLVKLFNTARKRRNLVVCQLPPSKDGGLLNPDA